jgi:hypothetical protein
MEKLLFAETAQLVTAVLMDQMRQKLVLLAHTKLEDQILAPNVLSGISVQL